MIFQQLFDPASSTYTYAGERETNPGSRDKSIGMMNLLDLPEPKMTSEAVPENLRGEAGQ